MRQMKREATLRAVKMEEGATNQGVPGVEKGQERDLPLEPLEEAWPRPLLDLSSVKWILDFGLLDL